LDAEFREQRNFSTGKRTVFTYAPIQGANRSVRIVLALSSKETNRSINEMRALILRRPPYK
jgi:hypothetical protein